MLFKEILPSIDDVIVEVVQERFKRYNNQSVAAQSLGMSRGTFRKYLAMTNPNMKYNNQGNRQLKWNSR